METIDDSSLLCRYAETGEEAAFAEIVRRYVDLVFSVALRCAAADRHLAEDIAQEVFALAARRATNLSRHPALEGWLHTTTRNVARHAVRLESRRRARERKAHAMGEYDPAHETARELEADWERVRPVLEAATGQLAEPDREAILMRFYLKRSFREISAKLGLTEDAARRRVERALEKLRRGLLRGGITSTGAALAAVLSAQAVSAAPVGLAAAAVKGAMSAGPAGASALSGVLHFMATSKIVAVSGGIVLIAAAWVTTREFQLAQQGEAELPAAQAAVAAMQNRLHALAAGAKATPVGLLANIAVPQVQPSAPSRQQRAASPTRENDTSLQDGSRLEAAHPDVRRASLAWFKAQLDSQYGPFFSDRKLTPDQIARFEDILLAKGMTHGINQYMFESTEAPIPAAQANAELSDVLGADGLDALQDYDRSSNARGFVTMVGKNAFDAGEPMTTDQSIALAKWVSAARAGGSSFDWDAVMAQAQGILSPGQVAALEAAAQQARFNAEFAAANHR